MNILSFDIEEWFIYGEKKYYGDRSVYLPRINELLTKVLDLLDKKQCKATFFCLGEVASQYPNIIRKIDSRGHDIGCHSDAHKPIISQTSSEFKKDTLDALSKLEDVIGRKVDSYRAPAFSITEETKWAIEVLAECGITKDCSIFPLSRRYGGYSSFGYDRPVLMDYNGCVLREFPISVYSAFSKSFVYSGGGYFRLIPYPAIKYMLKRQNYVMSYFHIRDFDKDIMENISFFNRSTSALNYFKNFCCIKQGFPKFVRLIDDFDFISVAHANKLIAWDRQQILHL